MYTVKRLETVTEKQMDHLANLCARAFRGDISAKALLGGDWSLAYQAHRAAIQATVLEGELYVVEDDESGEFVSTAFWFPNGKVLFDSENQRGPEFNAFFDRLSSQAKHWNTVTYPDTVKKLDARLFTDEEISTRWWCFNLATEAKHQGKGLATSLVKLIFDKADKTKTVVALATAPDVNVAKYRSMGFRERGGDIFKSPTGDFYGHVMSREPC